MDAHHLAKRKRPASARQHSRPTSNAVRMRHTQRPAGGGVSSGQRFDESEMSESPEAPDDEMDLFDRLHTGASATMSALGERARQISHQLDHLGHDARMRSTTWIVEPSWSERFQTWLADAMPFTWKERARRQGFWRRRVLPVVAIFAIIAVGFGVGLYALGAAGHAAGALPGAASTTQPQATTGSSVMISPLNAADTTPTPVGQQYTVGVWVSDTLPAGGSVKVFMRVSNNTLAQPGVKVYLHAVTPNGAINMGPFTTDAYGVATTSLNYGNVGSQQPIFLTATTTINGQSVSGDYTFVTF
ncbi:MAG TPA: hypothetical protein VF812_05500 [Ktedonobacterales bacterium]